MSGDLVALAAGTVLAVAALAFVLYPLFFRVTERDTATASRVRYADDSAILALREIEFDRATGKLSEDDYTELRQRYAERALGEMRRAERGALDAAAPDLAPIDPIEARVRAYRLTHRDCPSCGLRPEADAIYCSTCGGYLARTCPVCAAAIAEKGATFCSTCGATLARELVAARI